MSVSFRCYVQIVLCALALPSAAADLAPVCCQTMPTRVYQSEKYGLQQKGVVYNQFNAYEFIISQTKPDGKNFPRLKLVLNSEKFGFGSLIRFFQLKVNDIPMHRIQTRAEDMRTWRNGDRAGIELLLAFDGARFRLRLFMRPDSPVLWGTLTPLPDSLDSIRTLQVNFVTIPSSLIMKNHHTVWKKGYQRMAITPIRVISQSPMAVPLTPLDSEITFQDRFFDGSSPDKGQGPCWLQLDYRFISRAMLHISDNWVSEIALNLSPELQAFKFAIWQQKPRISNEQFARKLELEKAAFTR